jgi:hypothetical protein
MVMQHVFEGEAKEMTEQKPKRVQLLIPHGIWQRIEQEKTRRKQGGGLLRAEATAIFLEAVDAFLAATEKKVKQQSSTPERE